MTIGRLAALPLAFLLASPACARRAEAPASRTYTARPADPAVVTLAQRMLDSLRTQLGFPGATLGIALPDGRTIALATGMAYTARREAMRPDHRLLQGSVGKTYVAAVALQLVGEGKLDLDAQVERYLGHPPWFARLPNARDITVRQLMNHTSGLVRYEFNPVVADALRRDPYRVWTPEARLAVLLDTEAKFAAGQGWEYSDTNYIVLGMIIERLTGATYYDEMRRRLLVPLALTSTIPSDRPELPGVANGYAGPKNDLGGYDASVVNGRMAVNPQFEWTGGGVASTAVDLARWGKAMYEGRAFDAALLPRMLDGVPARLGPNARYGLGVIIRQSPHGETWGHSGFFPGYATELVYLPDAKVAVAIQVNVTDPYPRGLALFATTVARAVTGGTAGASPQR